MQYFVYFLFKKCIAIVVLFLIIYEIIMKEILDIELYTVYQVLSFVNN